MTGVITQLYQFHKFFRNQLSQEELYITSIEVIQLKLPKLQDNNAETKKILSKNVPENCKHARSGL